MQTEGPTPSAREGTTRRAGGLEKGGLRAALKAVDITVERCVGWANQMRVGLMGTTRRVWGVKVRQRIQLVREWRYLHLVVDPIGARLRHLWSRTMQGSVAATLAEATRTETDLTALVWDRAPSHRDAAVRGKDFPLIEQPSCAPELNPVDRVFEELRAHIEGIVYPTIEAKVAAVEAILAELGTDPERIKQLTRWHWIEANLHDLPQNHAA